MLPEAVPSLDFAKPPPQQCADLPWLRHIWFSGPVAHGEHPGWSSAALEALGEGIDDALLVAAEARVAPGDRFVIVHTSGSTSKPKGVIHAHGSLIRHLANINAVRDMGACDILFATSPWFWIAGFGFGLIGTLVAGSRIVCSNAAEPAAVLDFIERERPTMSNGYAPGMVRIAQDPSFAARDFSFMRRGNLHPIMPPDIRPADMDLRHNIYGMTEVGSALTMSADETNQPEHRRASLGQLLPDFEVRIVDPETGVDRPSGEVGELWVRGPLMMEGYYGTLRSEVFAPDGWWRSGDLCRIDADGFFYIAGRLGNMIKTTGANVSPGEVEAAMRALTGAAQCHVIGIPDAARGEVVAGVVVGDAPFDELDLQKELGTRLSSYKVPRRIVRLAESELPMLSSGKLDVAQLKNLVKQRW
jgi:acyl-CoA synthetase (AMP-forming)/AMP-acid ligase II